MRDTNPVYAGSLADPYVWRGGDAYYAIGTGAAEAAGLASERVFPLLRSTDLTRWEEIGHGLIRPTEAAGDTFWAPEVVSHEGRWYLYYSVGHEDREHQLRVAVSDDPDGPYLDVAGLTDVAEVPFAIDPHAFRDDDGRWYLFHARDFLDVASDGSARAGTALVVSELETMTQLAKPAHTVLRARRDWQRYARDRVMYGRSFDWHTLEGPCVLKHDGRYYCLYSSGSWQTDTYGVDFAVADHVLGPYDDGENDVGPRVLRTLPGRVVGPGHCSVVQAPDGEFVIAYHAWDPDLRARTMRLGELRFGLNGPSCPSFERDPEVSS